MNTSGESARLGITDDQEKSDPNIRSLRVRFAVLTSLLIVVLWFSVEWFPGTSIVVSGGVGMVYDYVVRNGCYYSLPCVRLPLLVVFDFLFGRI